MQIKFFFNLFVFWFNILRILQIPTLVFFRCTTSQIVVLSEIWAWSQYCSATSTAPDPKHLKIVSRKLSVHAPAAHAPVSCHSEDCRRYNWRLLRYHSAWKSVGILKIVSRELSVHPQYCESIAVHDFSSSECCQSENGKMRSPGRCLYPNRDVSGSLSVGKICEQFAVHWRHYNSRFSRFSMSKSNCR